MTYENHCTLPEELLEQIALQGIDFIPDLIKIVVNEAMKAERSQYLGAAPYERSQERRGYANGFKPKTLKTRLGEITFDIPQVRDGEFYPGALEKGQRSERALMLAFAEMYVQGVSTRKVTTIVEKMCGVSVSSTQVSRSAERLDEVLEAWRNRSLGICPILYLDARYENVRQEGQVRDAAILMASGVNPAGKREILGVSVSLSEAEVHWRQFLEHLMQRGLQGVQLIVSDDHAGLKKARRAVFGGTPWQRCHFHLQQNAGSYVPRKAMHTEVADDIRMIFNAQDRSAAEMMLKNTVSKYKKTAPRLSLWLEENIPEGLTFYDFPRKWWRKIRTSNNLERVSEEVKRRTRVVRIFPNPDSCLRLVSAILMEISEAWLTGKVYLNIEDLQTDVL